MKAMKKLDRYMMSLVKERPQAFRRGTSILYGLLIAWYLWDVVHQNPWWGIDYACAIFLAGVWGSLAVMWGRRDRADEIDRLVTDATGDPTTGRFAWTWAYTAPTHRQREILTWMQTHDMAAIHVDDMPPPVRDLAKVVEVLRGR